MTQVLDRLPRLLKEPTGWVLIVLTAGFFYMQWPTRGVTIEEPTYVTQQISPNLSLQWEDEPDQVANQPTTWVLDRKRMLFMVQTDTLAKPFDEFVRDLMVQDQQVGASDIKVPLATTEQSASYTLYDAENRTQEHRIFVDGDQWVKISMMYKPSMETRVDRAKIFLDRIRWQGQ
ncbi:hypothetical protein KO489_11435 [Reinekea forsetii]|nr:hypothetical protein [Reinekea forsetii]